MTATTDFMLPEQQLRALRAAFHDHWKFFLIQGILWMIMRVVALVVPPLATLAVTIVVGWLFVAGGIFRLISAFSARGAPGFWWSTATGILAIITGGLLLWQPFTGILSLTIVLMAMFLLEGAFSIAAAFQFRRTLGAWGWLLATGIFDIGLVLLLLWT